MAYFFGTYIQKLSLDTHQVAMPARFLKILSPDETLLLFPDVITGNKYWQLVTDSVFEKSIEHYRTSDKEIVHHLCSMALVIDLDSQGCFTLPQAFIEKLADTSDKEVVFEAAYAFIKLWSHADYVAHKKNVLENPESKKLLMKILKFD